MDKPELVLRKVPELLKNSDAINLITESLLLETVMPELFILAL
jgi:hypothetical protein